MLAKHIDLTTTKLRLICTDSKEGLHRIVCEGSIKRSKSAMYSLNLYNEQLSRGRLPRQTYPICEFIPNRAWSSGAKTPGKTDADRSFWMPACFPLKKPAMIMRVLKFHGCLHSRLLMSSINAKVQMDPGCGLAAVITVLGQTKHTWVSHESAYN